MLTAGIHQGTYCCWRSRVAIRAQEIGCNALGGVAVPKLWYPPPAGIGCRQAVRETVSIRTDEAVGSLSDGNGSLRIASYRQAGYAESGGLFLDSAGVGDYYSRVRHESEE